MRQKWILLLFGIMGAAWFGAYADLETNFLLKSAIILPIQVGGCLLLIYLYWNGRLKGTVPDNTRHPFRKL